MKFTTLAILLLLYINLIAQEVDKKMYSASKISDHKIIIDGFLNDSAWQTANWEDHFIQYQPNEGIQPYQKTDFAVLYDENNLYAAIKSHDRNPDSISFRLTRRDVFDGDMIGIQFDTYGDKRTAFSFVVSAAGVKTDFMSINDGAIEDMTWDPIWWVKTAQTDSGWNAEMRIPLSQLRFNEGEEQQWGLQAIRYVFRKDELSLWQPAKRDKAGWASQFGTMNGIKNIKPKNIFDVTPYIVARTERFEKEPDNPFKASGKNNTLSGGVDAKIGLTNFMTMDLTINPDFGQVEADPSEVNLTTYETFFPEKRPFFIEGKSILSFPLTFGEGNMAAEGLFYSRRIGRKPQYYPEYQEGDYAEVPEFTSILGAAKVTGKSKSGWSVGVLESVTAEENAEIAGISKGYTQTIEPLTNYFVTRVQKDFNEGNTYLGGMATAVNRKINDEQLEFLHKSAFSGGLDFVHKWNDRMWLLDAGLFFSQVNGTEEAITRTQRSMIRNYQRPDADYVEVDSSLTSLSGYGGKFALGKVGGKFNIGTIFSWKSPGLELNDIGYAQQVDKILQVVWSEYKFTKPFSIFRELNLHLHQFSIWDFGLTKNLAGFGFNYNTQFNNYWKSMTEVSVEGEMISNNILRGGPSLITPGSTSVFFLTSTNPQKKITFDLKLRGDFSHEKDFSNMAGIYFTTGYRPLKSLSFEITPGYNKAFTELQYVNQFNYTPDKRYVMAHIDRNTVSMSLRVNYNITPDLTIQYWGQPFVATGEYTAFKHITNSKAPELNDRYQIYSDNQISMVDDTYKIDENLDGKTDYSFGNPDFNVKEFLSNFVIRWEYQPGSTLYFVWSQTRNQYENTGEFNFTNDVESLFAEGANNIFQLKFSYRFGR